MSLVDGAAYDWAAESFAPARLMQPREGLPSAHQMSPRIERIRGPVFVQYPYIKNRRNFSKKN